MPVNPAAWHADNRVPSSGRNADSTYIGMRGKRAGSARAVVGTAGAFTSITTASTRRWYRRRSSAWRLGHRVAAARLEQKEVTVLVNRLAAEPEVPVDHLDRAVHDEVVESGLLGHLAARRFGRRLAPLEVALGEPPVLVRVPDQKKTWR